MKQLSTFGGRCIILQDDEAENVKKMWLDDNSSPIELRDGSMVNPKAIEVIGEVETKPFYKGMPMSKDMTRVFSQGGWKQFCGDRKDIEHQPIAIENFKKLSCSE